MELIIFLAAVLTGVTVGVVLYNRWKRLQRASNPTASPQSRRDEQSTHSKPTPIPPPAVLPPAPQEIESSTRPEESRKAMEEAFLVDDLLEVADEAANPPPPKGPIRERPLSDTAPIRERPLPKPAEPAPGAALTADAVTFSAYYPKEAVPEMWLALRAYVFRARAAALVAADAARALGPHIDDYRPVTGEARIPVQEGALVTATPELPGVQFNPPSASVAFYEDWHAFDFKLRATQVPLDHAANGRITFTVEGVIVADLPLSVFVTRQPASSEVPANPTASPYEAIFCSYSHADAQIVERVERAYRALGLNYLRDVTVLRSGEAWNDRLLQFIAQADIFQLFWSEAAAKSPYVEQEWRYALALARGGGFIRPVYWDKPLPPVPGPLSELHFHYDGSLDDLGYNGGTSG